MAYCKNVPINYDSIREIVTVEKGRKKYYEREKATMNSKLKFAWATISFAAIYNFFSDYRHQRSHVTAVKVIPSVCRLSYLDG